MKQQEADHSGSLIQCHHCIMVSEFHIFSQFLQMPILFPGKLYELLFHTCTMPKRVSHHTHLSLLKFLSSSFLPKEKLSSL